MVILENGSLSGSEVDGTGDSESEDNGKRKADSDGKIEKLVIMCYLWYNNLL